MTLVWETKRPYEAVVEASALGGALLRGLRLRHASPSVANNAAVFLRSGALTLEAQPKPKSLDQCDNILPRRARCSGRTCPNT